MHHLLLNAGISTFGYSGHSLRKGATVTADCNGISRHDIKLLGRWKSDVVDAYIDEREKPDHIQKILHLNARLLSPLRATVVWPVETCREISFIRKLWRFTRAFIAYDTDNEISTFVIVKQELIT